MKYKFRVFYYPETDNVMQIAQAISKNLSAVCDKIPPAYNCENEKLVIIGVELYKAKKEPLEQFLKNLNIGRAKNVAFYAVGDKSSTDVEDLKKLVTRNGVKVLGDTYICEVKNSLFKKGQITMTQRDRGVKWAEQIIGLINKQQKR